jgi:single-strand DNA-binding protein
MASYNKITLVGNVGKDPELKTVGTAKVVDFSIAINEPARGQQPERTEWYRVSFWDRRAETIAQYVRKGTQIMVEGRLTVRTFIDPNTQRDRYSLEVSGTDFLLLGSRPADDSNSGFGAPRPAANQSYSNPPAQPVQQVSAEPAPAAAPFSSTSADEDLPF